MSRNILFSIAFVLLGSLVYGQTFTEFDSITWSTFTNGDVMGVSAQGSSWSATTSSNCDATGFWGVQAGKFVIEDMEGTCGCPCFDGDASGLCGNNDNTIFIPGMVVAGYCQVKITFTVTGSGMLECGTLDDKLVSDFLVRCPQDLGTGWGGTDGMTIAASASSGDFEEIKICGSKGTGQIELILDLNPFDAIGIIINAGNQDNGERYEIGDIVFSGVARDRIQLNTACITCNNSNVICENSGLPITFQTIADEGTSTFQWTGPDGFSSTDARPEIANYTTTASGDYTVIVTEQNTTCTITETISITVLPTLDAVCKPSAVFTNLFIDQCSDLILPATDENGVAGTWSPSDSLSLFPDSTLNFTFTPTDLGVSATDVQLNIFDLNALENFGTQPNTGTVFCNASVQTVDLIDLFDFNLDEVFLQINGDGNLFPFINNGDFVNDFEAQFRNFSFFGLQPGTRDFFIEGISTCGTRLKGFRVTIVAAVAPVRIDTSLCEGDFIDTLGIRLFSDIGDTVLVDGSGGCDTILIASVTQKDHGRSSAFHPNGGFSNASCQQVYYYYDTLINGIQGIFVKEDASSPPPLGPDFDTIFTERYVGPFLLSIPANNGCDSFINISLGIPISVVTEVIVPVCENDTITNRFQGVDYFISVSNPRVSNIPINSGGACDFHNIIGVFLPLQMDTVTSSITRIFKEGQDTTILGVLFDASHPSELLTIPMGSANGCDASLLVDLSFAAAQLDTINERICPGDGVQVGDSTFTETVTDYNFTLNMLATNGGDSIVNVNIEVLVPVAQPITQTICREGSFVFMGETFDTSRTTGFVNLSSTSLACDSIIFNVTVSFFDAPDIMRDTSFCIGTSVDFPEYGITLDENNLTATTTDVTADGCIQNVFLTGQVLMPITINILDTICRGETYIFGNATLTEQGQVSLPLIGSNGCDSIVILDLFVKEPAFYSFDTSACAGTGFLFGVDFLSVTDTYIDTLIGAAANGCDSIVQVNLTIDPPEVIDSLETVCFGDSFDFNGTTYDRDTTIDVPDVSPQGCDVILRFTLDVQDQIVTNIVEAPRCADGTSVTVGSNIYNVTGIYRDTFLLSSGCDSIVITDLTIPDSIITPTSETICAGDAFILNGQSLTTQAIHDVNYFAANGCDSIVRVDLTVIQPFFDTIDVILCPGDDFERFNSVRSNPLNNVTTLDTVDFVSRSGCDSTLTVRFTYVGVTQPTLNLDICAGDSVVLGNQVFTQSMVGNITYQDSFGCDRMVVLNLNVYVDQAADIGEQSICPGEGFMVGDSLYTDAGSHVAVLPVVRPFTGAICDSTIMFSIRIEPILNSGPQQETICEGEIFVFGGDDLTLGGTYFDTLTANSTMCDSIVELELVVIPPFVDTLRNVVLCPGESYNAFNGEVVANPADNPQTTTSMSVFNSLTGCDTTIVVFITNVRGLASSIDVVICDGDTYSLGDSTFSQSGQFTVPLQHPDFACDSLVSINLSVIDDLSTDLGDIEICDGDSYDVGGNLFTTAGMNSVPLLTTRLTTDGLACDSIVTFNLIIRQAVITNLIESICDGDGFTVGGSIYTVAGNYSDTLMVSPSGCDSIVNLTLDVIEVVRMNLDTTVCFGDIVTVGSQDLDRTQMTDITILSDGGCDSMIVSVNLTVIDEINSTVQFLLCPGETTSVGGNIYGTPGSFEESLTASTGCDSTVRFTITLKEIDDVTMSRDICTGSTFTFGGVELGMSGTYRDTTQTSDGCDSITILTLSVVDQIEVTLTETICDGATFAFAGNVLDATGMYMDTSMSSIGCDSITTLDLTVTPPLMVDSETIIGACDGVSNGAFVISDIPGATGPYTITGLPGVNDAADLPLSVSGLSTQVYSYTVTDANGCTASNTVEITNDRSNAISISSVTIDPLGQFELFVNFDGTATSVTWDNIPGLSCYDCPNPMVTIDEQTTFTVTVVDVEGCVSMTSITLSVDGIGNIYVPSVFNPDSEKGNDRFFIQGEDNSNAFYDIWIYDRWGNLVYTIVAAPINERASGWDGRWGNKEMNPGVYVFTTRIYKSNGAEKTMNGDITIIK